MIKDNVPSFVANTGGIADLMRAEQPETDRLDADVEALLKEFFVGSFTEKTVVLWEEMCDLKPAPVWPIERRRERVRAAMCMPPCITPAVLKEIIEYTGGVEVEIEEDTEACAAKVRFVGEKGIPVYLEDILAAIERIRPFHIAFGTEYVWAKLFDIADNTLEGMAEKRLADTAVM